MVNAKEQCCTCYNPKLDELIYRAKYAIDKLSNEPVREKFYGYKCDDDRIDNLLAIQGYLKYLREEYLSIANGAEPCLNCYEEQSLAEKVRILTLDCDLEARKDIIIDESDEQSWIAQHPTCVSREKWEKLASTLACELKLEVSSEEVDTECKVDVISSEKFCNLTFELIRNMVNCDLIAAIYVHRNACDLNYSVKRTLKECELDYKLLVEQVDCNLTLGDYIRLVECNLSFDVIKTLAKSGCEIQVNNGNPVVVSTLGVYPLNEFQFFGEPNVKILSDLGADTSDSEYVKHGKSFLNTLNQDYSGN